MRDGKTFLIMAGLCIHYQTYVTNYIKSEGTIQGI